MPDFLLHPDEHPYASSLSLSPRAPQLTPRSRGGGCSPLVPSFPTRSISTQVPRVTARRVMTHVPPLSLILPIVMPYLINTEMYDQNGRLEPMKLVKDLRLTNYHIYKMMNSAEVSRFIYLRPPGQRTARRLDLAESRLSSLSSARMASSQSKTGDRPDPGTAPECFERYRIRNYCHADAKYIPFVFSPRVVAFEWVIWEPNKGLAETDKLVNLEGMNISADLLSDWHDLSNLTTLRSLCLHGPLPASFSNVQPPPNLKALKIMGSRNSTTCLTPLLTYSLEELFLSCVYLRSLNLATTSVRSVKIYHVVLDTPAVPPTTLASLKLEFIDSTKSLYCLSALLVPGLISLTLILEQPLDNLAISTLRNLRKLEVYIDQNHFLNEGNLMDMPVFPQLVDFTLHTYIGREHAITPAHKAFFRFISPVLSSETLRSVTIRYVNCRFDIAELLNYTTDLNYLALEAGYVESLDITRLENLRAIKIGPQCVVQQVTPSLFHPDRGGLWELERMKIGTQRRRRGTRKETPRSPK